MTKKTDKKPQVGNPRFLTGADGFLKRMEKEARRRGAAVFKAEAVTAGDPFRILVFTMLSARTKDETTIRAIDRIFKRADSPKKISKLSIREIEMLIHDVGFFHVKAKHLKTLSSIIAVRGEVPDSLEELLELPGVGRKTANIVLARAFGRQTLGVDTHVHKVSNRLGLVKTKRPEQTERELEKIFPKRALATLNRAFVGYGQTVCLPRRPLCAECLLNKICPKIGVVLG